ncbi:MAG: DUF3750 domain-containing protein [Candidatus Nomurabacteria bacterium]|nr:DUF3750 domain-containing protein [Candidatus Nomurabacteria bacterium]
MLEQEFKKLIKEDKYQVFVFESKAHFPFFFAAHPWFVINKKENISRYEVVFKKDCCPKKSFGHVHVDALPPHKGIRIFPTSFKNLFWKSRLIGFLEGGANSSAEKAVYFIENSKYTYPHLNKYVLTGPNSNTYLQWVLDAFPELNIKLSYRFIGKGYKTIL